MYKTLEEAKLLAKEIVEKAPRAPGLQVALFPPAVSLAAVSEVARKAADTPGATVRGDGVLVGAQNMHFEAEGAFTGEISASMILSAGGTAVLLGHSERRHVFGESDELVGKKVESALGAGLLPVLCVGEKLEEREAQQTMAVVSRQLDAGLRGVASADALKQVIIAYEPVWAIGTGKTATPEQGQEVHSAIRAELARRFGSLGGSGDDAAEVLILYGGSVKPDNAGALLAQPDIDGLLVGGASLKADSFLKICQAGA
jgi:triosephosphate isomerase